MRPDIAEMFAELDGAARYHEQLELWAWWALERDRARDTYPSVKLWRKRHPDRAAELAARCGRNYRARHAEKVRSKAAARKKQWRLQNPDKARAQWRKSTAAYRARKQVTRA